MTSGTSGPQFVSYFSPVLEALHKLGSSGRPKEVTAEVARICELSAAVVEEQTEGGRPRFPNRVAFPRFYLAKSGYIDAAQTGLWALIKLGRSTPRMTQEEALRVFREVHAKFSRAAVPTELAIALIPEVKTEEIVQEEFF